MPPSKIRLLLVDDHEIVRAGLRMLLQAEEDMEVVGEASGGAEAVRLVAELLPDVVVMDISMPGISGIEATRQIKKAHPQVALLALTMYEDEAYFFQMLAAGACGYIPKRAAADDLVTAIRVVSRGYTFLYPSVARLLVEDLAQRRDLGNDRRRSPLTPREEEVLKLIAEGYSSREIAETLVISCKTVERHRENIMHKLNLHNRVALVRYAIDKGLISLND